MTFKDFELSAAIITALEEKGYQDPTPVQKEAIPQILLGRDVLGSAQTGTGKTAAFCIPILEKLNRNKKNTGIRALMLTPTRELAIQVFDNLKFYGKHLQIKSTVIYGGVPQYQQAKDIRNGVDILVATPGRLLDLMNQGILSLKSLEILVLDEADRMLDMGFINDIRKLLKVVPAQRQNIFFSATMPAEVQDLVKSILKNPVRIAIENKASKPKISQSVYMVARESKRALLKHVIAEKDMQNVIVFARTKYGADKIAKDLNKSGIKAEAIHGDKTQHARQRALTNFKRNDTRVLVATDIASRGIDIVDLPFVINYELPESAETYTHRIGRTGRAGQTGFALSFCDNEEKPQLSNINRSVSNRLTVVEHPFN
ncbi:MAG TPA: DEAD/DEAH box helicase [Chryseolinea sp.]